jgi:hypothetical protein
LTPRIRYPSPDTIIAVDPDVPAGRQRVVFEAAPVIAGLQWRLDDTVLPDVRGRATWTPRPGRHTLVLEDATGRALSRVGSRCVAIRPQCARQCRRILHVHQLATAKCVCPRDFRAAVATYASYAGSGRPNSDRPDPWAKTART